MRWRVCLVGVDLAFTTPSGVVILAVAAAGADIAAGLTGCAALSVNMIVFIKLLLAVMGLIGRQPINKVVVLNTEPYSKLSRIHVASRTLEVSYIQQD